MKIHCLKIHLHIKGFGPTFGGCKAAATRNLKRDFNPRLIIYWFHLDSPVRYQNIAILCIWEFRLSLFFLVGFLTWNSTLELNSLRERKYRKQSQEFSLLTEMREVYPEAFVLVTHGEGQNRDISCQENFMILKEVQNYLSESKKISLGKT